MSDKIYIENPYLKELKATVISKYEKNGNYHVILNRTIFYPRNSNAGRIDRGFIEDIEVIDVFEQKGDIIHVVKEDMCSKDINIEIDWNMRFDYMQQHTGGHILSTSINKLCGADTLKLWCEEDYSYISINLKELRDSDINRIEKFANQIIYSNFQVRNNILSEDGIKKRNVSIENMSNELCEELHCSSTGEVGIIKIMEFKENKDENIDIKFVCGNRALKNYSDLSKEIKQVLEKNKALKQEIEDLKNIKTSSV